MPEAYEKQSQSSQESRFLLHTFTVPLGYLILTIRSI